MGNIITTDSGYLNNTELGKIIDNWARYDYDAGLGYGKDSTAQVKELLKKRACCVGKNTMSIALPKINLDEAVKGTERVIESEYTPVLINFFKSRDELQRQCNIETDNYALPLDFGVSGHLTEDYCTLLYEGSKPDNGLCYQIKNDRRKQLSDEYKIAYGIYPVDKEVLNVYSDCNCLNSTLRNKPQVFSSAETFDVNLLVQKFDARCSLLGDNAYKKENFDTNLCINIVNAQNLSAEENSSINTQENCNFQKSTTDINNNGSDVTSPSTTTKSVAPTPTTTTSSKTNKQNSIITPVTVFAIISIISIILFILKMYIWV